MKRGYIGQIGNEFVFVEAKDISEGQKILEEKSEGKEWKMEHMRHFKVINQ